MAQGLAAPSPAARIPALLEHPVQNHRDHAVAKLAVNQLIFIPLQIDVSFPDFLNCSVIRLAPNSVRTVLDVSV
jgi:hypothetical protein